VKENLKPYVYKRTKHVKVRCGTFCRTVRRVDVSCEVKRLRRAAAAKARVKRPKEYAISDPKPGDLSMSRMKFG
jgi:hypothetical protein